MSHQFPPENPHPPVDELLSDSKAGAEQVAANAVTTVRSRAGRVDGEGEGRDLGLVALDYEGPVVTRKELWSYYRAPAVC
jgi:hypothetical protein